jgi:predicted dehydrogenase
VNVGIIGCGLIGQKRAAAISAEDRVVAVADLATDRAEALARRHSAEVMKDAEALVKRRDVDVVVVATTHNVLAETARIAVEHGKHVLLEKPGARRPAELEALAELARSQSVCVQVGFNHRYHPALLKAHALIRAGEIGPLYYIRGRYGHGGRIGYDREWRANPEISGGGELLDQGAHLIDLAAWFFDASFTKVHGVLATYFWNMPVEDNAFLTLETGAGMIAQLQVTWTEWKNLFSFEIVGRDGKLHIDGLGGSYGVERLAFYKMRPEMGPPDTTIWEYPGADNSWAEQWRAFSRAVAQGGADSESVAPSIASTQRVLDVVERVYQQNKVSWLEASERGSAS